MGYVFPADLAEQVTARWRTFLTRHDSPAPPLPPLEHLTRILETAFFASFVREEGRDLRFVLCCATSGTVEREGVDGVVPALLFDSPREITAEAIRSLAPAVSPANAAILVHWPEDGGAGTTCTIGGVLNVGSNLGRARSGRSFYHRPSPYALVIDVRGPGELHVYRGGIKLATLQGGGLQDQLVYSGLEFIPVSELLAAGGAVLHGRIAPPATEAAADTADFEWMALLNTILCIVNGIREHSHGGALLLVTPGFEHTLPIRLKFDVDSRNNVVADRFVDFINARHRLAEARHAEKGRRRASGLSHLENATFVAEQELADAADLVARLTAVDGALVIGSDLRIHGFGAEIVLDAARPVAAYEVSDRPSGAGQWPEVDSESFGMRHRSALRCVAVAEKTAAFVVSQDGPACFMWKRQGHVLLKRNVNTANPNMIGA